MPTFEEETVAALYILFAKIETLQHIARKAHSPTAMHNPAARDIRRVQTVRSERTSPSRP
ncbi:MAG TPA: hypothetical protein VE843_14600 [Ktedonobacteraceae bacterium]|nr:hypothetical protein [Ktedonobacteraceae bacterium]